MLLFITSYIMIHIRRDINNMNTHPHQKTNVKRRRSAPQTPKRPPGNSHQAQIYVSPSDPSPHPSGTELCLPPSSQPQIKEESAKIDNQPQILMKSYHLARINWPQGVQLHFNPQEIKMQEGQEVILGERWRGRNHSRAQNLKNIASHILNIIISNENLTVKQIGYLLFQIMGQTKFGAEVIQTHYPELQPEKILELTQKYKDDKIVDSNMKSVIRNVRRRLYDALNVMISTQIIRKMRNSTFKLAEFGLKVKEEKTQEMIDEDEQLKKIQLENNWGQLLDEVKKTEKRIAKKKRMLKEKQDKLNTLRLFISQNQYRNSKPQERFNLPLIVVKSSSKLAVHLQSETLRINSRQPMLIFSDLDILQMIQNSTFQNRGQIMKLEEI